MADENDFNNFPKKKKKICMRHLDHFEPKNDASS